MKGGRGGRTPVVVWGAEVGATLELTSSPAGMLDALTDIFAGM